MDLPNTGRTVNRTPDLLGWNTYVQPLGVYPQVWGSIHRPATIGQFPLGLGMAFCWGRRNGQYSGQTGTVVWNTTLIAVIWGLLRLQSPTIYFDRRICPVVEHRYFNPKAWGSVPRPATIWQFTLGLGMAFCWRRRNAQYSSQTGTVVWNTTLIAKIWGLLRLQSPYSLRPYISIDSAIYNV